MSDFYNVFTTLPGGIRLYVSGGSYYAIPANGPARVPTSFWQAWVHANAASPLVTAGKVYGVPIDAGVI